MPRIAPIGNDFVVNSVLTDNQTVPVAAPLANGRFIVLWTGSSLPGALNNTNYANADIRAQIYNADGTPSGSEFVVNATTPGVQFAATAIQLTDGNILVAWQDGIGSVASPASTPTATIRAQEFTSVGVAVGSEFQIGAGAEAILPALAPLAGGGFMAAWQVGRSGSVVGQTFDNANAAAGSQFTIDSTQLAQLANVRLATLANGNVAAAWQGLGSATNPLFSIQVYSPTGAPVGSGSSLQGGSVTIGAIGNLVALASGGFALADQYSFGTNTFGEVSLFFPDGSFATSTVFSTQAANVAIQPRIAPLPDGGLAVAYFDNATTGTQPDLFAQRLNAIGDLAGDRVALNTTVTGVQATAALTALSTGDLVAVWRDDSAGNSDIRARLIDYDATNGVPTATAANLVIPQLAPGDALFDEGSLTDLANDPDGDPLHVTAITNVTNGTAVIEAGGTIRVSTNAGAPDAVSFDYTVSDGNGGTATARARVVTPTDFITLRGSNAIALDFQANDFLQPRVNGYAFAESSDYLTPVTINGRVQFQVNPFGSTTAYYDLLVGQTQEVRTQYLVSNPVTSAIDYAAEVVITLQGWAQIGGTARDALTGTALADSLQGGTGAANELIGGAGDDTYTSRAAGDTIVELVNGGTDTVRTDLANFRLAENVENLFQIGNPSSFTGIGNSENNLITGISSSSGTVLAGLIGNDTLTLLSSANAELIGGQGDDIYVFTGPGITVFENVNEGSDTVRTGNTTYTLPTNVENLTYTGSASATLTGTADANTLTGGAAAASTLVGLDGNDTYVVRNIGDTIVETAAGGTDTISTALSFYRLNTANVENLTYTGTGNFTGIGNALDNAITGGVGRDYLYAGQGVDTLTGGAGADVFLFDTAVDGVDRIADFVSGSDRIFLNQGVFTHTAQIALVQGAGAQTATSANSTFLYDSSTGQLGYDADGTGAGAAIAFAFLSSGLTLTTADFAFYG